MRLESLSLIQFKSHAQREFDFIDGINCIVGNNGVGKTNVLDAIYYMSFCKSYFNPIDSQNIKREEPFFMIQGTLERDGNSYQVACGLKRGDKKTFKFNGKKYKRLADHIGKIPLVMMTPSDTDLIHFGSDVRRKFMDGVIAQYDSQYLDHLLQYNKVLNQRNAVLKQFAESGRFDSDTIYVWDAQLDKYGSPVYEGRKAFMERFIPVFQKYYHMLAGGHEEVTISYESQLHARSFADGLADHSDKDRRATYTTFGVHKDDLQFLLDDFQLKRFGSQGQQKSFIVALKLAQFDFIRDQKGVKPLLLLDDIFDKLDSKRIKSLLELVSEHHFGQVFITDANKLRVEELFADIGVNPNLIKLDD